MFKRRQKMKTKWVYYLQGWDWLEWSDVQSKSVVHLWLPSIGGLVWYSRSFLLQTLQRWWHTDLDESASCWSRHCLRLQRYEEVVLRSSCLCTSWCAQTRRSGGLDTDWLQRELIQCMSILCTRWFRTKQEIRMKIIIIIIIENWENKNRVISLQGIE